jgi:hypothetical protein
LVLVVQAAQPIRRQMVLMEARPLSQLFQAAAAVAAAAGWLIMAVQVAQAAARHGIRAAQVAQERQVRATTVPRHHLLRVEAAAQVAQVRLAPQGQRMAAQVGRV